MSFVAALPADRRAAWLSEAAALVEAGETPPEWEVHVVVRITSPARV